MALAAIGAVWHSDGTVVAQSPGASRFVYVVSAHADQQAEIVDTRDALETLITSLAASRRTEADLERLEDALVVMERDVEAGGRGLDGDELFHATVTAAAHSLLLSRRMGEIADLTRDARIESLWQPDRQRAWQVAG